jgi:cystathionine beta-lyase
MEFLSPPQIVSALEETAKFGMWGYTGWGDRYYNAIHKWMKERHNWEISRDSIIRVNGVVQGLGAAVRAFTKPGDSIVIQPPVYFPFYTSVRDNDRVLVESPLKRTEQGYEIDFADLEEKLSRPEVTAMIICSPHNPVGRVWTEQELRRVGDLCLKYNVFVICDEIHNDLIHKGNTHTVYATLGEEYAKHCVIGTACSKTFSLAGLCLANMIVPDPENKALYEKEIHRSGCTTHSTFGTVALEVGYEQCGSWVDELVDYVYDNYLFMKQFLAEHFPSLWVATLEGTYLAWVNMSSLTADPAQRTAFLHDEAKLWLTHGGPFGDADFERINLACARSVLEQALDRLLAAAKRRRLI